MNDCCVVDQKRKKCVDIGFDDSACTDVSKCCVGISENGRHNKCLAKARECRKLGNAWDPIGPLKPLNFDYLYTQAPGYATTGSFVEHFDGGFLNQLFDVNCIAKNAACSFVIALIARVILGSQITIKKLIVLTILIAIIKCCMNKL